MSLAGNIARFCSIWVKFCALCPPPAYFDWLKSTLTHFPSCPPPVNNQHGRGDLFSRSRSEIFCMIKDLPSTKISLKRMKFIRKSENCWDLQVSYLSSDCVNTRLTKNEENVSEIATTSKNLSCSLCCDVARSQFRQCQLHLLEIARITSPLLQPVASNFSHIWVTCDASHGFKHHRFFWWFQMTQLIAQWNSSACSANFAYIFKYCLNTHPCPVGGGCVKLISYWL